MKMKFEVNHKINPKCCFAEVSPATLQAPPAGVWLPVLTALLDRSAGEEQWEKGLRIKKAPHHFHLPQKLLEALKAKIHDVLSFKGRLSLCQQERIRHGSGKEA